MILLYKFLEHLPYAVGNCVCLVKFILHWATLIMHHFSKAHIFRP